MSNRRFLCLSPIDLVLLVRYHWLEKEALVTFG